MSPDFTPLRIVQITDWLPPEFSAVSQYALMFAEEQAAHGSNVVVVGLSSSKRARDRRSFGAGEITVVPVQRRPPQKHSWLKRLAWSLVTNAVLIRCAWPYMRSSHLVRFTGSPPFMLHCLFASNLILKKRLLYRITDFYPECIIAALNRKSAILELARRITNVLRRRVDAFEVIGNDMKRRLLDCGVQAERVTLRRDTSPVHFDPAVPPLTRPPELKGKTVILYSGNWGVAHDVDTFFEGYKLHHRNGSGSVFLWLNATGSGADELDRRLRGAGLPFHRQQLVALNELPRLLITPDAHLVTLSPQFMGFVLPSKIYGCIASRRPILYVGPTGSDVHQLCVEDRELRYDHVDVGDATGVKAALDRLVSFDDVVESRPQTGIGPRQAL